MHGGKRAGAGRKTAAKTLLTQTINEKAAQYGDDAIAVMVTLMNDSKTPENVRLAAANSLLDRGFGKPKIQVDVTGDIGFVDKEELDRRYQKNMAKTAEMALVTQERIKLLKKGTLH
jgi:hypothetical protein